jgi:hypothetical protein
VGTHGAAEPDVPRLHGDTAGTWSAPRRCAVTERSAVINPHPNLPARYGRCRDCDEIKQVTPDGVVDGVVQVHNRYRTSGTAVVASPCAGSGSPPVDSTQDELSA